VACLIYSLVNPCSNSCLAAPPLCLPLYPIRVKFNVKGPRGQGEVYAEITSENAKSEYTRNMTEEYDTQKQDTHCRTLAALTDMECPHFLPTWPHFTTARPFQVYTCYSKVAEVTFNGNMGRS
jgi:hypothetical protein